MWGACTRGGSRSESPRCRVGCGTTSRAKCDSQRVQQALRTAGACCTGWLLHQWGGGGAGAVRAVSCSVRLSASPQDESNSIGALHSVMHSVSSAGRLCAAHDVGCLLHALNTLLLVYSAMEVCVGQAGEAGIKGCMQVPFTTGPSGASSNWLSSRQNRAEC